MAKQQANREEQRTEMPSEPAEAVEPELTDEEVLSLPSRVFMTNPELARRAFDILEARRVEAIKRKNKARDEELAISAQADALQRIIDRIAPTSKADEDRRAFQAVIDRNFKDREERIKRVRALAESGVTARDMRNALGTIAPIDAIRQRRPSNHSQVVRPGPMPVQPSQGEASGQG